MTTQEKDARELLMEIREKREKKQLAKRRRRNRKRITALVLLAAVITATVGVMYNVSAKDITITEINEFTGLNESQTVRTRCENVEEALEERGISINETDRLNVPVDKPVADNDDIVLTRGKRVTIKVGGYEEVATITKADVTDALVEAGYIPGAEDSITSDGDTIELVSVSRMDEAVTEKIERGVEYVDDPDLPKGQEKVVDEGEDGLKEIQHKVTYLNGEESERETTSEVITSEPRNKVIARGTAENTVPASASSEKSTVSDNGGSVNGYRYKRKLTMTATAYSASPSENAGYSTSAMGTPLRYGVVAVDPNVIPLGSKVYVTSADGSWVYGVASAEDTGGAIRGNKIDLCYPTGSFGFGRRSCVVYVLE